MVRLLAIALASVSVCAAGDPQDGLVGALRWYYRWISELPHSAKSVDCRVATFPSAGFAYCEPGALGIDLESQRGALAVATNVTRALSGFSEELADFVNHRYLGPDASPTVTVLSFPAALLSACRVDLEATRRLVSTAVGPHQRKDLLNRGITLRFPLACEGDPFYLVYFMKGGDLQWIWQVRPGVGPVWSYDKNGDQRRIPDLAIKDLGRPELWYNFR